MDINTNLRVGLSGQPENFETRDVSTLYVFQIIVDFYPKFFHDTETNVISFVFHFFLRLVRLNSYQSQ